MARLAVRPQDLGAGDPLTRGPIARRSTDRIWDAQRSAGTEITMRAGES